MKEEGERKTYAIERSFVGLKKIGEINFYQTHGIAKNRLYTFLAA